MNSFEKHENKRKSILGNMVSAPEEKENIEKEPLVKIGAYITSKQRKAIKKKIADSDNVLDKDLSSIIRASLDMYLADVLSNM